MRSTDLKNPGADFGALREMAAYATSKAEISFQLNGNAPSDTSRDLAEFVTDWAKRVPGPVGLGVDLGDDEAVIKDQRLISLTYDDGTRRQYGHKRPVRLCRL